MGDNVFLCSKNLTTINFAQSGSLKQLGANTFAGNERLQTITLPEGLTKLGENAFNGCTAIVEVINNSRLSIKAGSTDYGYAGYYAIQVHTGESLVKAYGDFLFYSYNGVNYLIDYVGDEGAVTLPSDYNGESKRETYRRLLLAKEHIEQHYDEPITLERLAFLSDMSVTNFRREWKKIYSDTPMQYRDSIRLYYAKEYLNSGYYTVTEIAEKCGFDDVSYFVRFFKQKTGLTPGEFKKESFSK
jgi:AraC-like DNA-binding protein